MQGILKKEMNSQTVCMKLTTNCCLKIITDKRAKETVVKKIKKSIFFLSELKNFNIV